MLPLWEVAVAGAGGGLVNGLLAEAHVLWFPEIIVEERPGAGRRRGLRLGFVGNILVGTATAFLSYLVSDKLTDTQQLATAFAAAIGGASVQTNIRQRLEIGVLDSKVSVLENATRKATRR
jgi:hypothetical protein